MKFRYALVALLLAVPVSPAAAHQGDPFVFARIDAIDPAVPGLTVEVRTGPADQLLLVNDTGTPVEVLDADGEPFLRIGPDDVSADVTSAAWHLSNSPEGTARTPAPGPPFWRTVARGSSWGWFDHRMHDREYDTTLVETVTRLADWTVPLRVGEREVTVRGHTERRPWEGSFRSRLAEPLPDLDVDVADGRVPGLFARWHGSGTVVIYGIDGEPFARLGPRGTEVNEASPTWRDDQQLRGVALAPYVEENGPRWHDTGADGILVWLDRRLAYAPGVPSADVLRAREPVTVVEWDIRVDMDGTTRHLQGVTEWVPFPKSGRDRGDWRLPLFAGLLGVFGAGVGLLLGRRLRR